MLVRYGKHYGEAFLDTDPILGLPHQSWFFTMPDGTVMPVLKCELTAVKHIAIRELIEEVQGMFQAELKEDLADLNLSVPEMFEIAGFQDALIPLIKFNDFSGTNDQILERLKTMSFDREPTESPKKCQKAYHEGFLQGIEAIEERLEDVMDALEVPIDDPNTEIG